MTDKPPIQDTRIQRLIDVLRQVRDGRKPIMVWHSEGVRRNPRRRAAYRISNETMAEVRKVLKEVEGDSVSQGD